LKFSNQLETNNGRFTLEENGVEVGAVTSHTFSHKLNTPIGLAYIKSTYLKPYTQLTLKNSGSDVIKSEVYELPFVK